MNFRIPCPGHEPKRAALASLSIGIILVFGLWPAGPARAEGVERGAFGRPMMFEANQGQTDAEVKFLARGRGYNLYLTATQSVLSLKHGMPTPNHLFSAEPVSEPGESAGSSGERS